MAARNESASDTAGLDTGQYRSIAAFRHELRRFLAFSEAAAAAAGLPAQQHQALLVIAGCAGPEAPTVGLVAQQLIIAPHTAAELVSRMVAGGLLVKTQGTQDARRQELALTPDAATLLQTLTAAHLRELVELREVLAAALQAASG
jgi:DNA-binding MarR family transcriptional regulator